MASHPAARGSSCSVEGPRMDCGWVGIDGPTCVSRGCCWRPVHGADGEDEAGEGVDGASGVGDVPWCFHDTSHASAYNASSCKETGSGVQATLVLASPALPSLGPDISPLKLSVSYETNTRLHVKLTDPTEARWEVPESLLPRPAPSKASYGTLYDFNYTKSPFGFTVSRKENGEVLFNTTGHSLFFKDQYVALTSSIPESAALYGLGETTRPTGLRLRPGTMTTMWNRDIPVANANINLYGTHPFLLDIREGGLAHGVFFLNCNGMDVLYTESMIEFRAVGGVLDFYFFLGPSPSDVIQQYQDVIGRPMMPPLWSLGFHQCRYGYKNVEELESVVDGYASANIPLEVMWNDIDYMDGYRDFTLDKLNYALPKMRSYLQRLHDSNQRWVPIIDPGIMVDPGYPAYDAGIQKDIFLKDASGERYAGKVWPPIVHFPDWFHPDVQEYWTAQLRQFHDQLAAFDGIWADMNEASNFCSANRRSGKPLDLGRHGMVGTDACSSDFSSNSSLEHPPYRINNANGAPLSDRSIPVSMLHHDGVTEYDAHNIYGFSESVVTVKAVAEITEGRPFVLSRSTFPGAGKYVAHWSGDNMADWNNLRWSIVSILNANLFGIPMTGADICGFFGTTTEELCARWISLGAFTPFTRAHSDHVPQELYLWPKTADAARKALGMRMRLTPYLYSAFKAVHSAGGTVASPLWMAFPEDSTTYDIDRQFLLGPGLLVSPVLEQGADRVDAYFPNGTWYDLWNNASKIQGPGTHSLEAPVGDIPVHVLGGTIIPTQAQGPTTAHVRETPLSLIVALAPEGDLSGSLAAQGSVYMDAGDTLKVDGPDSFTVEFEARTAHGRGVLTTTAVPPSNAERSIPQLGGLDVLGFECPQVDARDGPGLPHGAATIEVSVNVNGAAHPQAAILRDVARGSLHVSGLATSIERGVKVEWRCDSSYPTT
eukprot:evm.model.scf_239.2 EVM.evm.TU.scf_239.2   scf_239:64691-80252(-)